MATKSEFLDARCSGVLHRQCDPKALRPRLLRSPLLCFTHADCPLLSLWGLLCLRCSFVCARRVSSQPPASLSPLRQQPRAFSSICPYVAMGSLRSYCTVCLRRSQHPGRASLARSACLSVLSLPLPLSPSLRSAPSTPKSAGHAWRRRGVKLHKHHRIVEVLARVVLVASVLGVSSGEVVLPARAALALGGALPPSPSPPFLPLSV